jgi:hypothetical protein
MATALPGELKPTRRDTAGTDRCLPNRDTWTSARMRDGNWDTALTPDTVGLQSNRQTVCGLLRDHADLAPATAQTVMAVTPPKAQGNICAAPWCYVEVSEPVEVGGEGVG